MVGRLAGKVALVTGIGGGIGKGCALLFAQEGAAVFGSDIDAATAQATVEEARGKGLEIHSLHPCDLTLMQDAQRLVAAVLERYGRLDVLINAAAIAPHMAACEDMDYETQWRPTIAGELDIVFLLCKAAWPHLRASGRASIINFSSVNAGRSSAVFGMAAHCAGKAAVEAMTRQLAREGGPYIRANTIAPGLVVTPATMKAGAGDEERKRAILSRVPMQTFGEPEDVAWCAVYLASDEARWVTGANFAVDGGTMAC